MCEPITTAALVTSLVGGASAAAAKPKTPQLPAQTQEAKTPADADALRKRAGRGLASTGRSQSMLTSPTLGRSTLLGQ